MRSACGHASPRPGNAAAKRQRQFALGAGPHRGCRGGDPGVGPQRQCKKDRQEGRDGQDM